MTPPEIEKPLAIEALIERAIVATGQDFLNAERELIARRDEAEPVLTKRAVDSDPLRRFIVGLLAEQVCWPWLVEDARAAQELLDGVGHRYEHTAAGSPPPIGVARNLSKKFGERVAGDLTSRLLKQDDWPHWRVFAVLVYLQDYPDYDALPALEAYAARALEGDIKAETQFTLQLWRAALVKAASSASDLMIAAHNTNAGIPTAATWLPMVTQPPSSIVLGRYSFGRPGVREKAALIVRAKLYEYALDGEVLQLGPAQNAVLLTALKSGIARTIRFDAMPHEQPRPLLKPVNLLLLKLTQRNDDIETDEAILVDIHATPKILWREPIRRVDTSTGSGFDTHEIRFNPQADGHGDIVLIQTTLPAKGDAAFRPGPPLELRFRYQRDGYRRVAD